MTKSDHHFQTKTIIWSEIERGGHVNNKMR